MRYTTRLYAGESEAGRVDEVAEVLPEQDRAAVVLAHYIVEEIGQSFFVVDEIRPSNHITVIRWSDRICVEAMVWVPLPAINKQARLDRARQDMIRFDSFKRVAHLHCASYGLELDGVAYDDQLAVGSLLTSSSSQFGSYWASGIVFWNSRR